MIWPNSPVAQATGPEVQMRSRCVMALVMAFAIVLPVATQDLPNTKELGRAAIEYRDDTVHLVAAYYYSQLNHETRWLLTETGLTTEVRTTIPREAFWLILPAGIETPLAAQERFSRETEQTRLLRQNAALVRHNLRSYFNRRPQVEPLRFFSFPPGPLVSPTFASIGFGSSAATSSSRLRPASGIRGPTRSCSSTKVPTPRSQSNYSDTAPAFGK